MEVCAGFHRRGYHQQSGLNCTGLRTIRRGPGYHRMYGETTICDGSLCIYVKPPSVSVMEREECGVIRVGFAVLPGRCEYPVFGRDLLLLVSLRGRQG